MSLVTVFGIFSYQICIWTLSQLSLIASLFTAFSDATFQQLIVFDYSLQTFID